MASRLVSDEVEIESRGRSVSRPGHHSGTSRHVPHHPRAPLPPAGPRPRAAARAAICAALVVVTLAAFRGVLSGGFLNYDDNLYVTENAHVRQGLDGGSLAWAFTTTECANWHPLTWLSHMLDVRLFGLDAGKHHLTSLLLHAANAVALFLLLVRMTGALWRSALAACLFAVHPLHVESVAWIAERKDVLSTLFWLLTLAAWLSYLESKTFVRYVLVLGLYALALMAKPMPVTLPFTLLLLDTWPLGRLTLPLRGSYGALAGLLREKAPLFAMAAASCIATFVAQRSGGAVKSLQDFTFAERLGNAVVAYVSYLGKAVWPTALAIFYPHRHVGLLTWAVAGSALLLVGATALALRVAARAPYLTVGWLWYAGTLVPVIGLLQVGGQAMAERYTYVPFIGVFIAVAWGLGDLARGSRLARHVVAGATVAALLPLCAVTRAQVGYWADGAALYEHALAVTSDNWLVHNNLGLVLFKRGKTNEAIAHYTEALRIWPDYAEAHYNLGIALGKAGRRSEAIEHYEQALRLRPDLVEVHYNLGNALLEVGRFAEAINHYDQALRLDPDDGEAHNNLGNALARQGRIPEAIEHYDQALRLDPDSASVHNNLGAALVRQGRLEEAIGHYRQAVRLSPDFAEAHNDLGVALARENRFPEAVEHFQEALRIKPDFDDARANLVKARERLRPRP
jgi:tetratricopeptide (TPR) repeat protein